MKRAAFLGLLWLFADAGAAEESTAEDGAAKLRWKNFEAISGELRDATPTELSWQSPLFEEPLRLRWDSVRRIDHALPAAVAPESFSIALRDGSHLVGDILKIDADTVSIKSARHGEVALKRSEVLRAVRLRGGKIIAAGPAGDVGWKVERQDQNEAKPANVAQIVTGPGGVLVMPYWNTKATLAVKTPDRMEIEIALRFTGFPAFALRFDGDSAQGIRIETWDDELVVAHGNEFQSVARIAKDEREISLRICWDRKAKSGAVFSASGDLLTAWKFTGDLGKGSDWSLQNKGRDLTLAHFCAREWDGNPPAKLDPAKPRTELADARVIEGGVIAVSGGVLKMAGDSASAAPPHPLAEVAEIIFSTDAPKPEADAPTFAFADGTLCHGRLVSIADGRAVLETSFAAAPLAISMSGLRQVRLGKSPPVEPDAAPDEIQIDSFKFHGTLTAGGDARLRWLPFGGVTATVPKSGTSVQITRAPPPDDITRSAPALLYTSFGDIIPATFRGLGDAVVEIESDMLEVKTLPVSDLDAVQFGDVTQASLQGFASPGWHIVKGDEHFVKVSKDHLEIEPGGAFGHPFALQSDEFRLSFNLAECGAFRLRLFSGGNPERTTNFVVAPNGGTTYVSVEDDDGQFNGFNNAQTEPGKPVEVRVKIQDASINIYIGERLVQQAGFDPKRRTGSGLVIEPSIGIGNAASTVKLTGFSTKAAPGRTWLPGITPETKAQTLTVPRFRKERPPRHALVATNGDVLRGEIEATTATHFGFISGLEKLRIPRSRVNAVVFLKPPRAGGAEPAELRAIDELLKRPLPSNSSYGGISCSSLLSILSEQVAGLEFNSQLKDDDNRRMTIEFHGQSVREALEQICRFFHAHFRVEENGSITIESGPDPARRFVEKNYWLKSGAFPDADAAEKWLKEKGIEFPEGTSARWNPGARQLAVKHTVAAQVKIEAVLKKEFGANPAAPTHWLQLTNGARLVLAVEQFGTDFITGQHPVYGMCRVPMPLVFNIQTSKPAPTEVMRSLADWTLTTAREPVISESGGESSPTLGRDASTFKIPLLGGGDFDLQAERGKVVVLDFWATWCAPCIKSLPGLIEATGAFPSDRVKLIGVNQGEAADAVKRFIETRGWQLAVAMDSDQKVAQQYGVTGIPHTVIVGPDGKVAWVKTGFSPDGAAEAAKAITALLGTP